MHQKMNLLKKHLILFYVWLVISELYSYIVWILAFGPAVLDECLLKVGLNNDKCILGKTFNIEQGSSVHNLFNSSSLMKYGETR